jgi:hypothetical protein
MVGSIHTYFTPKPHSVMRNSCSISFVVLFVLTALVTGCRDEAQGPAQPGNVRFTIHARPDGSNGRGRVATTLPVGASLYVTVADASGNEVYSLEEVALLVLNGEYISTPLALPPGNYTLTEFLVADVGGEIVYATPKEGSSLAPWVDDPLPAPFVVTDNAIAGLDVQVLAIGEHHAGEFGYVTFGVEVSPFPYFKLSVFAPENGTLEFVPVRACILQGTDTIYQQSLSAGMHDIAFVGDLSGTYTLVVTQHSYRKVTRSFVLGELVDALAGVPLAITLEPALTLTTKEDLPMIIGVGGAAPGCMIDWGDGTVEPITVYDYALLQHTYPTTDETPYFVSIYGDLSHIDVLSFSYDRAGISEISLKNVPALKQFFVSNPSPVYIDFTHNPGLEMLVARSSNLRSLALHPDSWLMHLDLAGNYPFSDDALNAAIHAAYRSIDAGWTLYGIIHLNSTDEGMEFVGNVTPESFAMLRALRDTYGWIINPSDF